mgnify:CR=1 FL=1
MSRGPVKRCRVLSLRLPQGLITLCHADISAQNHALFEGASDPYPNPLLDDDGRQRAAPTRAGVSAHRRDTLRDPPTGGGTPTDSTAPNRHTGRPSCDGTTHPQNGTTLGGGR